MDHRWMNILLESILLAGERLRVPKIDPPNGEGGGGGGGGGWQFFWRNPFLIRLVLIVGMGALIIGYDNGAVLSALPLIQRETEKEKADDIDAVVSGPALAMFATVLLRWFTIVHCTPRTLILAADLFFIIGSITSLLLLHPWLLVAGRFLMGFGIGIANTNLALYISEIAPAKIRGALVSTICLLVSLGHLLSYPVYLLASKAPGTWYWMIGLTGVLSCFHFRLMQSLPESPSWLYRKDKIDEAKEIMEKTYPSDEFEKEVEALELSVEDEKVAVEDHDLFSVKEEVIRGGAMLGFGCGMCNYLSGYSMVTYYCPLIVKLAGYSWNMTPLMLSLITSGLSVVGFIITILFVDRIGRRRLLLISMFGIISCLGFLSFVFHGATIHSKTFSRIDSDNWNDTCSSDLTTIQGRASWNCRSCFEVGSGCLYINTGYPFHPGLCIPLKNMTARSDEYDTRKEDVWEITRGSVSLEWLAMIGFGLYIISYSLGMGTVPFIVNSEIYPLGFRNSCGGFTALIAWDINAFMSMTLNKTVNKTLNMSIFVFGEEGFTFLFFCLTSCAVTWLIYLYFPETKGVCIEEINYMFREINYPMLDEEDQSNNFKISEKGYYYRIEVDGLKYRLYHNDIRTGSWKID